MDYFVLRSICCELQVVLTGKKIRNCFQTENQTFVLLIDSGEDTGDENAVIFRAGGLTRGIFWDRNQKIEKSASTLLARSFRKKIGGARIVDVRMPVQDRFLCFVLDYPEWSHGRELWFEFTGGRENLICVDSQSSVILECLSKHPELTDSGGTRIPGMLWQLPKRNADAADSMDPYLFQYTLPMLRHHFGSEKDSWKSMLRRLYPMTPTLAKKIGHCLLTDDPTAYATILDTISKALSDKIFTPCIIQCERKSELHALDFGIPEGTRNYYDSMIAAANEWKNSFQAGVSLEELRSELLSRTGRIRNRLSRNIDAARQDLAGHELMTASGESADLLAANFHLIKKGMTSIRVENFFLPGNPVVTIELDSLLAPKDQVNRLFKQKNKAARAIPIVQKRLVQLGKDLSDVQNVENRVKDSHLVKELEELRSFIGLDRIRRVDETKTNRSRTIEPELPYMEYISTDGWNIWVGRNAEKNDAMTFKKAAPHDIWLHAFGQKGAHVIIRNPNKKETIPPRTIEDAAKLAVFYSKARGEKNVQVISACRKHLRKPSGKGPGLVIVTRQRAVIVHSPQESDLPRRKKPRIRT